MPQQILVTSTTANLAERLTAALQRVRPSAIGFASAFVSVSGVELAAEMMDACGASQCRLIAGTSNYITHPEALTFARERGWELRLGESAAGIFHPKLIVAGEAFKSAGPLQNVCAVYVGSANLSHRGFTANTECGLLSDGEAACEDASAAFATLWRASIVATDAAIQNYAATFAEISRARSAQQLDALGVCDAEVATTMQPAQLIRQRPPRRSAVRNGSATSAWTGLESFTGEYRFQVEFPRAAGEVVARLVNPQATTRGRVDVLCTNDNHTRGMQFRFYPNNGMFRLNVPNDLPNVAWVRAHQEGLTLIQPGPAGGAPIRLTIHLPGAEATEVVGRSVALGTWGKTSTRLYGWS
jgi:HKD family nuclease